jgi:hypothetical protein
MRRIAIALIVAAAVVGIHACAADAPTAPKPGSGGTTSTAVSVQLFTSDANPKAGTCTLIEALVTLNGAPVPDGTSVNFTTDFGTFGQNGLALVSVVTTSGSATTALCGPSAGSAKVKGTATIAGKTNSGNVSIVFQPDAGAGPHVSFCSPSFGPIQGGTILTLNGGGFVGSAATTRVQFTANGVTKDGLVTSVTPSTVTVTTPGFPEFTAPAVPVAITLTFNANVPPIVVSVPSCFSYGTADSGTPTVTAVLPSSGTNSGNTRVTVIGSGFASTGVQVFFGTAEATVVSASYNQVVVLSPKVTIPNGTGGGSNLNQTVAVTVKNIASGLVSNASVNFTYTPAVAITSWTANIQPAQGPFSPVTIFGQGFQAPMAVDLAGVAAFVQSVSATEVVVIPGTPLVESCADITGVINVVNIDTGDGASNGSFTYVVQKPAITGVSPGNSCVAAAAPCDPNLGTGGGPATISGLNLPAAANADVKFGTQTAFVNSGTASSLSITIPITSAAIPTCAAGNPAGTPTVVSTVDVTVTDRVTTCTVVATGAFQYIMPCVAAP